MRRDSAAGDRSMLAVFRVFSLDVFFSRAREDVLPIMGALLETMMRFHRSTRHNVLVYTALFAKGTHPEAGIMTARPTTRRPRSIWPTDRPTNCLYVEFNGDPLNRACAEISYEDGLNGDAPYTSFDSVTLNP